MPNEYHCPSLGFLLDGGMDVRNLVFRDSQTPEIFDRSLVIVRGYVPEFRELFYADIDRSAGSFSSDQLKRQIVPSPPGSHYFFKDFVLVADEDIPLEFQRLVQETRNRFYLHNLLGESLHSKSVRKAVQTLGAERSA